MAKRKATVVDEDTGEILGTAEVQSGGPADGDGSIPFPEEPLFKSSEEAVKAIARQSRKCDKLEESWTSAKAEQADAKAELEKETDRLRAMTRSLSQMRLLPGLLLALLLPVLLALSGCGGQASAAPQVGGAPGGWDDLIGRQDDFEVRQIEPGVALLIDRRTLRGWILAGSSQSWQAIEPIGGL